MSATKLDSILEGRRSQPHMLVEVMLDLQDQEGYLPEEALKTVSKELGVPLIDVYRVAHFYKAFSLKPRGKNVITICTGTACHVRGSRSAGQPGQRAARHRARRHDRRRPDHRRVRQLS